MGRPGRDQNGRAKGGPASPERKGLTRRQLLARLTAGALVVGFDPAGRRWVAAADTASCPSFDDVPRLDGTLYLDGTTRSSDARDLGRIVERVPCAVLRPGSVEDIAVMVRYCQKRGIKVACRGQGHTMFGQSLVGGLLIENRSLNTIHSISSAGADVDAGVLWKELVLAAYDHNPPLTPPLLTGYIGLSIAGTLSVGGLAVNNDNGLQIDHVQELEVVTGDGRIRRCSMTTNQDLFEVLLGGLGQCGIITRATVDLVPAKSMVRTYQLHYVDNASFFRDIRTLAGRGELDGVFTLWVPESTGFVHQINAVAFFDGSQPPDDQHLLRGLTVPAAAAVVSDSTYVDWAVRVDVLVDEFRLTMNWDELIKPWFDVWLNDRAVERYVGDVIPTLTPEDVGPGGFLLLFPQRRSRYTRRFYQIPEPDGTDWIYLFDILTASLTPSGPDPTFTSRMLARNRRLFEKARDTGGTRYPIGAIEFTHEDWVRHYGDLWPELVRRKRRFDPDNILTPGPGIF